MNIFKRLVISLCTIITVICFIIGIYQLNQHYSSFFGNTVRVDDLSAICNDKEYYEKQFQILYTNTYNLINNYDLNTNRVVSAKAIRSEKSTEDSAYKWVCDYKIILRQPVVSGYYVPNPEHSVLIDLNFSLYCSINFNKYIYSVCR